MFISRVEIPWQAARNPYDIHRQLWRMFPGEERESRSLNDERRHGFLFRAESQITGRPVRVLLQSRVAPTSCDGVSLIGTRSFDPAARSGQRLAFLLTANPVRSIVDEDRLTKPEKRARTCRVPIVAEAEQTQWLARKFSAAATVEAARVVDHVPLYFRKGRTGGKVVTCTFEGVICVSDPAQLKHLLENGVGPAKAFGCGLLLVRRTT